MMPSKSTFLLMLILAIVAVALGYNYYYRPFANLNQVATEPTTTDASPTPTAPSSLTAEWPPETKIAQLIALPVVIDSPELDASASAWIATNQPGFVTLFGTRISTASATRVIDQIDGQAASATPVGIVVDHEGGTTQRLNGPGFTSLPSWQSLCTQSASVSGQTLGTSANEIKRVGVDIVLAPVIDVATGHPTLGNRICSGDSALVEERAIQYIAAMGGAEVIPVLKHFPGIGQTTRDLHRQFDRLTVASTEASLYPRLLDKFPQLGVMISHVGVVNQYPDIPCSLSPDCVGQLKENYPEALIFSDALEMESAGYEPDSEELKPLALRSAEAIVAGNQILIYGPSVTPTEMSLILSSLVQRYQADPAFAQVVDAEVEYIARWKQLRL